MKSKLISVFSAVAVALIASANLSHAVVYTPSQFNTELKAKVGTKKGASAANAAANFYAKALGDKANKKNADKYAKSITKLLKKPVTDSLKGAAANALTKALLKGYFKGLSFSLNDKTYNKALSTVLKFIPLTQKTEVTSQMIYNSIKTFAGTKGVSSEVVYNYYAPIAAGNLLPAPVS